MVLKKYVNENYDLQVEVLCALQLAIAKLEHPPSKLCDTQTHAMHARTHVRHAVCNKTRSYIWSPRKLTRSPSKLTWSPRKLTWSLCKAVFYVVTM